MISMLTLYGCRDTTLKQLNKILTSIEIPAEITGDIELKTSYGLNGVTAVAEWHSTAGNVISDTGEVFVQVYDQTATLHLKLSLGEHFVTKNFNVTVKGSEDLALLHVLVQEQLRFESYEITSDLPLYTTYIQNNKTIYAEWHSDNEEVIAADGTVRCQESDIVVTLTVVLRLNTAELTEAFTFTVLRDSALAPVNWWHTVPVWTDTVAGEAKKPVPPHCFPGAVYRKVFSARDWWLGIEAVVTLPEFTPDPERFDETKLSYYLDNASLYLGGNAQFESDVGLTWSIGYPTKDATAYSRSGIAFRPFWRYITNKEPDCKNCYRNSDVKALEYYYFPGDKIRISVFTPEIGYLQMRIELLVPTEIEKYAVQRSGYELGSDFNKVFTTPLFPSEGMGAVRTEFKRVNAIDQVGNEGHPTINTNAKAEGAIWHEVYLYREITGAIYRVPMTAERRAEMACPAGKNVNGDFTNAIITSDAGVDAALGGETVTLDPCNGTGKLYNSVLYFKKKEKKL